MPRILIVEDEKQIAKLLAKILAPFGKVEIAHDGGSGYVKYLKNRHDLIICDVAMPISDGLAMAGKIRAISANVPIVVVSAFSDQQKLLKAIDIRVNKYLIKPINPEELIAAVSALLGSSAQILEFSGAKVDLSLAKFTSRSGEESQLSRREMELLKALCSPVGVVLSTDEIKQLCWGHIEVQDGSVRTLIKRLRDKMGADARLLANQSNAGYKLISVAESPSGE